MQGTRDIQGIVLDLEKKNFPRDIKARAIAWQQLRQTPNFTSAVTYFREIYKEHHHRYATKDGEVILNATSFESMVNLRLLQFSNVKLEGHLKRLPAQLKWLQWRKCSLRSLPSDFFPRELAVLDLSESKIERIWGRKWCWHAQQVLLILLSFGWSLDLVILDNNMHHIIQENQSDVTGQIFCFFAFVYY